MTSNAPIQRAVVRINLGSPLEHESDTMLYLRTEIPHLHDIAISGPFHCIEAVFPNFLQKVAQTRIGMEGFEQATESGNLMSQFYYLTAPLDVDPLKTFVIDLIRIRNAKVMAHLPCPVYNVVCAKPFYTNGLPISSSIQATE